MCVEHVDLYRRTDEYGPETGDSVGCLTSGPGDAALIAQAPELLEALCSEVEALRASRRRTLDPALDLLAARCRLLEERLERERDTARAEVEALRKRVEELTPKPPRRCRICGHPENDHHYRHPLICVGPPPEGAE